MSGKDEFGNSEREIRMVAIAARARGDFEAERIALDRLAVMERKRRHHYCSRCDGRSAPRHRGYCPECGCAAPTAAEREQ